MWRWEALLGNGPDYSPQAWLLSVIADWETVWKQWADKVYPFMGRTMFSGSAITHQLHVANSKPSLPDSCSLPPYHSYSRENLFFLLLIISYLACWDPRSVIFFNKEGQMGHNLLVVSQIHTVTSATARVAAATSFLTVICCHLFVFPPGAACLHQTSSQGTLKQWVYHNF